MRVTILKADQAALITSRILLTGTSSRIGREQRGGRHGRDHRYDAGRQQPAIDRLSPTQRIPADARSAQNGGRITDEANAGGEPNRPLSFNLSSVSTCNKIYENHCHRLIFCAVQLFKSKEAMQQQKAAMLEDEESLASLASDADDSDADFIVGEDNVYALQACLCGAYLCPAPFSSSITSLLLSSYRAMPRAATTPKIPRRFIAYVERPPPAITMVSGSSVAMSFVACGSTHYVLDMWSVPHWQGRGPEVCFE